MAEANVPDPGPVRRCQSSVCSQPLPPDAGPRRRYCSAACRQEAHRARHRRGQPTGPQQAARTRASAEDLRRRVEQAQGLAAGMRRDLLQRVIWPHARHSGVGPGGYTTAAAELAAAVGDVLAAAVAADRAAGLSWEQIGAQLGIDATTARRRYAHLIPTAPTEPATGAPHAPRADLPPDTRPLPSVAPYDQLLRRRPVAEPKPPSPQPRVGQGWDDTDVCLWREDGRWGLTGPDGPIEVPEFGLFGNSLPAGHTKRAQAAAADAITALTGRQVTGWDQDESSRSVYGPASWYACLD